MAHWVVAMIMKGLLWLPALGRVPYNPVLEPYFCLHLLKRMKKTYMIKYLLVGAVSLIAPLAWAQESQATVNWLSFEQAVEKSKTEKRKIFIDVYTDWCGWCKVMDKNTFSEPLIAKILNEKFYPVKFDAEQKEDVVFNGNTFKFVAYGNKGSHQLAMALLNNQLAYPTVVFLDEEFRMIQPLQGYQKPPEFHKIIQYIGFDHFKTIKWETWQMSYKSPYESAPAEKQGSGK
jgi:thioredoxin-related protein